MKTVLTIICVLYSVFYLLLFVGVIHFQVPEKSFLVVAGTLTLLFCFSLLALLFIARSIFFQDQNDTTPQEAEERTLEISQDQPEQLTDEQITAPNVDVRIQEHRRPVIAKAAANRGGPATSKYMNTPN